MSNTSENGEQERKITILDSDECTPCEELKAALKEEIESGKVRVLDVRSDEALELLEKAGASEQIEYPSAIIENGEQVNVCQVFHDKEVTLAACGNEIVVIRDTEEEQGQAQEPTAA